MAGWGLYRLTQKPLLIPDFSWDELKISGLIVDWNGDFSFKELIYPGIQIQGLKTRLDLFRLLNKHIESLHVENVIISLALPESEPDSRPPVEIIQDVFQEIAILRDYRLDELVLGSLEVSSPRVFLQNLSLGLRRGKVSLSGKGGYEDHEFLVKNLHFDASRAPDELAINIDDFKGSVLGRNIQVLGAGLRVQILEKSVFWLSDFFVNSLVMDLDSSSQQKIASTLAQLQLLDNVDLKHLKVENLFWPQPLLQVPALTVSLENRRLESDFQLNFADGLMKLEQFKFLAGSEKLSLGLSLFRLYLQKMELAQIEGLVFQLDLLPNEEIRIPQFQIKSLKLHAEAVDVVKNYLDKNPIQFQMESLDNIASARLDVFSLEGLVLRDQGNTFNLNNAAIKIDPVSQDLSLISSGIQLSLENQSMLEIIHQSARVMLDSNRAIHVKEFTVDGLNLRESFITRFTQSEGSVASESSATVSTDGFQAGQIHANLTNIHLMDTDTHIKQLGLNLDPTTMKWDASMNVKDLDLMRLKPDLPLKKLVITSLGSVSGQGIETFFGDLKLDFILAHESVSMRGIATVIGSDLFSKIDVDSLGLIEVNLGLNLPTLSVKALKIQSLQLTEVGVSLGFLLVTAVLDLKQQDAVLGFEILDVHKDMIQVPKISGRAQGNLLKQDLKSAIQVPKILLNRSVIQDTGAQLAYGSRGLSAVVSQGGGTVYLEDLMKFASAQKKPQSTGASTVSSVYMGPNIKLSLLDADKPVRLFAEGFETSLFAKGAMDMYSGTSEPRVTGLIRIPELKYSGMGIKAELKQPARMEWIGSDVTSLGQLRFVTEDLNAQLLSMWQESNRQTVFETGLIVFADLLTEFQGGKYNLRIEGPYPRFYYKLTSVNGDEEEGVLGILVQLLANKLQGGAGGGTVVLPQELFMTHRDSMMNAGVSGLLNQNMPKALQLKADVLGEQKAMGIKTQATENISFEVIQQMGPQGNNLIQSMQWQMRQDMNVEFERIEGDIEDTKLKLKRQIRF